MALKDLMVAIDLKVSFLEEVVVASAKIRLVGR